LALQLALHVCDEVAVLGEQSQTNRTPAMPKVNESAMKNEKKRKKISFQKQNNPENGFN
jgi:hypothetical protein